jgi:hypothetical protein
MSGMCMRMRKYQPRPQMLACGALEDNGRYLFIKKIEGGIEKFGLPCALLQPGSNPVEALAAVFREQLGIDAHVGESIHEARHNAGTRRIRHFIPVLVFRIATKNASAKPAPGLGVAWMRLEDAKGKRMLRDSEWLNQG